MLFAKLELGINKQQQEVFFGFKTRFGVLFPDEKNVFSFFCEIRLAS